LFKILELNDISRYNAISDVKAGYKIKTVVLAAFTARAMPDKHKLNGKQRKIIDAVRLKKLFYLLLIKQTKNYKINRIPEKVGLTIEKSKIKASPMIINNYIVVSIFEDAVFSSAGFK